MNDGESVRIRPDVTYDAQQNPVTSSGPGSMIHGCVIEPVSSEELVGVYGRGGTTTMMRVYAPGPVSFAIHADDIAEIRGVEYKVFGEPAVWVDTDPELSGPVITVIRGVG